MLEREIRGIPIVDLMGWDRGVLLDGICRVVGLGVFAVSEGFQSEQKWQAQIQ